MILNDLLNLQPQRDPADDWSEHISSSGKKYYYNCRTEVSQWEKPKDWLERLEALLNLCGNKIRSDKRNSLLCVSNISENSGEVNRRKPRRPFWSTVFLKTEITDRRPCRRPLLQTLPLVWVSTRFQNGFPKIFTITHLHSYPSLSSFQKQLRLRSQGHTVLTRPRSPAVPPVARTSRALPVRPHLPPHTPRLSYRTRLSSDSCFLPFRPRYTSTMPT